MQYEERCWTFIDEIERKTLNLSDKDVCYYYLVRTSGGYQASEANSRIANFKKSPERFGDKQDVWGYKEREIERFANDVRDLLSQEGFTRTLSSFPPVAIAPLPTSKPKNHVYHDARLSDLCRKVADRNGLVRFADIFDMRQAVKPAHEGGPRSVEALRQYIIMSRFSFEPRLVILVDDVLTTGNHYLVCRDLVRSLYPAVPIIGLFLSIHRSSWFDNACVTLDPLP